MSKINKNSLKLPLILIVGGIASLGYLLFLVTQEVDLQKRGSQLKQVISRNFKKVASGEADEEPAEDTDNAEADLVEVYAFTADGAGQTPFSLLIESEEVEYDEYDFGVFIQSINNQSSDSDNFWALYVNDEFSQEAGDKIEIFLIKQIVFI